MNLAGRYLWLNAVLPSAPRRQEHEKDCLFFQRVHCPAAERCVMQISIFALHVAMEPTGVYWKPVRQALEGNFDLILANPYRIKTGPGRKTDARDSRWIAELLAHGLIRRSLCPHALRGSCAI